MSSPNTTDTTPIPGCREQRHCSPCLVCADVRARLKGHECSRLDGEHGLASATMRGFERLLELETWPAKFRAEAAELRKANTPKATGGAIVYEDMAGAIERFLGQANAEVSHAAPPAASDKPTAQRGGVALH